MANSLLQGLAGGARGLERALQLMFQERSREAERGGTLERLQAQLAAQRSLQESGQTFTAEQNRLSRESTEGLLGTRLDAAMAQIRAQGEQALKRVEEQARQGRITQDERFKAELALRQRLHGLEKELVEIRASGLGGQVFVGEDGKPVVVNPRDKSVTPLTDSPRLSRPGTETDRLSSRTETFIDDVLVGELTAEVVDKKKLVEYRGRVQLGEKPISVLIAMGLTSREEVAEKRREIVGRLGDAPEGTEDSAGIPGLGDILSEIRALQEEERRLLGSQ